MDRTGFQRIDNAAARLQQDLDTLLWSGSRPKVFVIVEGALRNRIKLKGPDSKFSGLGRFFPLPPGRDEEGQAPLNTPKKNKGATDEPNRADRAGNSYMGYWAAGRRGSRSDSKAAKGRRTPVRRPGSDDHLWGLTPPLPPKK